MDGSSSIINMAKGESITVRELNKLVLLSLENKNSEMQNY